MSHSSYTSSERRGILAIALAALLIIGSGIVLGLCGRPKDKVEEIPVVVEHPQMIDSTAINYKKSETGNKQGKSKNKKIKSKSSDSKKSKTYRRRSPLDEPV